MPLKLSATTPRISTRPAQGHQDQEARWVISACLFQSTSCFLHALWHCRVGDSCFLISYFLVLCGTSKVFITRSASTQYLVKKSIRSAAELFLVIDFVAVAVGVGVTAVIAGNGMSSEAGLEDVRIECTGDLHIRELSVARPQQLQDACCWQQHSDIQQRRSRDLRHERKLGL